MKHIKKLLLTITALALVLSLSGCYWKGNTKHHSEQLILDALEEKYNEKFFIREIAVRSSYPGRPLAAYCSPKDDEELIFEVQYQEYEYDVPELLDTYIQSIVRREMYQKIDEVLSEHFDDYAVGIYIYGISSSYNSGITNASEATIASYTEAIPNDNKTVIWLAFANSDFANKEYDIMPILSDIVDGFHMCNADIECYYVDDLTIDKCTQEIEDGFVEIASMDGILSSQRPIYCYRYSGAPNTLALIKTHK